MIKDIKDFVYEITAFFEDYGEYLVIAFLTIVGTFSFAIFCACVVILLRG